MWRKIFLCLLALLVLALVAPIAVANAQGSNGSIRGTVYNDLNEDGFCVGTGEPGQPGVPVEFVNQAGGFTIPLMTGQDGSFGVVAIALGTWQVTVKPPSGWRVTSLQTINVTLTDTQPVAGGVDFCIAEGTGTDGGTSGGTGGTTLPESGAAVSPSLLIAGVIGAMMLVVGAGFVLHSRKSSI